MALVIKKRHPALSLFTASVPQAKRWSKLVDRFVCRVLMSTALSLVLAVKLKAALPERQHPKASVLVAWAFRPVM